MFERTILAFGSESGNAKQLAKRLSNQLQQQSQDVSCENLDDLNLDHLDSNDLLLVITSTFGDGAPPGNARAFAKQLSAIPTVSPFQYAVFGLGDVGYPKFCEFGKTVDSGLSEKGARRLVNRVDADLDYPYFFTRWEHCISDILAGKRNDGLDLTLKVEAYSESRPYLATVNSVEPLNDGSNGDRSEENHTEAIYHIDLNLCNSDINYRAGDLLYVIPDDDANLHAELADWFGPDEDMALLAGKELRILGKSLLRGLATASSNKALKENLKVKNKAALAEYLHGRDLLDVLGDCGEPGFIGVTALAKLLPSQKARAYLVASCGVAEGGSKDSVHLCVRDVTYQTFGRNHNGAASHSLCQAQPGNQLKVFVRSNPEFWLAPKPTEPVLMIGEGTGIAPYIGFLQAIENASDTRETMLILAGQHQAKDFPYQSSLTQWLERGVLNKLKTAFSTDPAQYNVQQALLDAAPTIYQMLENHAHIYICGSKQMLDKPVDEALQKIIQSQGMCDEVEADDCLQQLYNDARIHKCWAAS
ncbi:MAG: sulfite reductase flavoprotein subunit alpha [Cyanobacteria bacterium P01_F01_bin.150]